MALEAYSQFHAFDWQNDTDWLKHKANLFVSDDSDQAMLKVRQKWFKLNIVRLMLTLRLLVQPEREVMRRKSQIV